MQAGVNTIAIQGIDLQVVRQGTGRPLFLLHGGDGPQGLVPLLTRLAERFDVSAPTHPGSAGTAIPEHFDTLEDLVYLYLDLLDVLDLHDVILSGCRPWGDGASGHPISLRKKPPTGRKKRAIIRRLKPLPAQVVLRFADETVPRLFRLAPGHLAARRQTLAAQRDIGLIWLPQPCAALHAMDQLWREWKGHIAANYPYPTIDEHAAAAEQWIMALTSTEARRKAGILSKHFWLKSFLK